jgi:nucleoside-diphosphate-sugar epimerase
VRRLAGRPRGLAPPGWPGSSDRIPSGVYNVVEDVPATRAEHARILSALTRVDVRLLPRTLEHLPLLRTLARSHRVSNLRFRQVAGWRPSYPDPQSGWERILATVGAPS